VSNLIDLNNNLGHDDHRGVALLISIDKRLAIRQKDEVAQIETMLEQEQCSSENRPAFHSWYAECIIYE
jgi:hypothetical protein